jgi:hypothetical protein
MSKHHHDEGGELHFEQISHHGVRYEPRDLGGRGIIIFLIVLVITGAVLCAIVWGYYDYHLKHMAEVPPVTGRAMIAPAPIHPTDVGAVPRRFPKPALQTDDVADLNKFRENEENILNSYGWVDKNSSVVHIPIDEAMKQVVKQGLPTRQQPELPQVAQFGNGTDTVPGIAGGTRPVAVH